MSVRILVGDCRDVLMSLPDASIDCIITDPPYGDTNLPWDKRVAGWPGMVRRLLKPTGSMWVFGSQRMFWETRADFAGWKLAQDVVWEKHNGSGFATDRFRRVHESALQFYRDDAPWSAVWKVPQFTNDATSRAVRRKTRPGHWHGAAGSSVYTSEDGSPRMMRSVIYARSEHGRAIHPTQKPIGVVEPLVLYSWRPSGLVLDLFAGSGTTGLVAQRHGRNAMLIEGDAAMAQIARDRVDADRGLFGDVA